MLAQFASRLRTRQTGGQGGAAGGGGAGIVVGEDGEAVLMDDNCSVSVTRCVCWDYPMLIILQIM